MPTVGAVINPGSLDFHFLGRIWHSGKIPRIFDRVREVDMRAIIIECTKLFIRLINSWLVKTRAKDALTVILPTG